MTGVQTCALPISAPAGADPRLGGFPFVDGSTGWLGGGGAVWLTADSGRTWSRQGSLRPGWTFAAIVPIDGSTAVAQAATGAPSVLGTFPWRLLLTEDAGRSWREITAPTLS